MQPVFDVNPTINTPCFTIHTNGCASSPQMSGSQANTGIRLPGFNGHELQTFEMKGDQMKKKCIPEFKQKQPVVCTLRDGDLHKRTQKHQEPVT